MRKAKIFAVTAVMLLVAGLGYCRAERLISDEKAIKEMLPETDRVEKIVRTLTEAEIAVIKGQLGSLTLAAEGGKKAADVMEYAFYFGMKGDKKTGVALFDSEPGKWGAINFIYCLDPETGKIRNMAVVSLSEKRGRPVALKSFLKQFFGRGKADPFDIGKGLNAIAGATVSSKTAAFSARKAVVLYDALFPRPQTAPNPQ